MLHAILTRECELQRHHPHHRLANLGQTLRRGEAEIVEREVVLGDNHRHLPLFGVETPPRVLHVDVVVGNRLKEQLGAETGTPGKRHLGIHLIVGGGEHPHPIHPRLGCEVVDVLLLKLRHIAKKRADAVDLASDYEVILADETISVVENRAHIGIELNGEHHNRQPHKVGNGKPHHLPHAHIASKQSPH